MTNKVASLFKLDALATPDKAYAASLFRLDALATPNKAYAASLFKIDALSTPNKAYVASVMAIRALVPTTAPDPAPVAANNTLGPLITGPILFYLELILGGKTFRYCTKTTIELTDSDDKTYVFDMPFDMESYDDSIEPPMNGFSNKTIGFQLHFEDIDFLTSLGLDVAAGEAKLYKGYENNYNYDQLISLLSGRISEPMILADGTFAFNLYNETTDKGLLIDPDNVVRYSNFPDYTIPDGSLGAMYPLIIGSPGYGIDGVYQGVQAGGIAININYEDGIDGLDTRYIIAGHKLQAGSVFVRSDDPAIVPTGFYSILEETDENNVTISYIDFSSGTGDIVENTEIYIGFDSADAGLAGIGGVGDFLIFCLQKSGLKVNWDRVTSIRKALNDYKIDTQILENPQAWQFVFDNFLSYMPISYTEDGDGMYPILWDFKALPVANLTVGQEIHPVEDIGISYSDFNEVVNNFIVKAGKNSRTGRYAIRDHLSGNYVRHYSDPRLIRSFQLFGQKQMEVVLDHVADTNTISMMVEALITRFALPYRIVEYISSYELDYLEHAQPVQIIDEDLNLDLKAFVLGKKIMSEAIQFKFIIFDL